MAIGTTAALLLGGAAVGSAALSSSASRSAGRQVSGATDRAADLQNQQFQQLLQLQMPGYRRAEGAAGIYSQALGLPPTQGYGGAPGGGSGGQSGGQFGGMMTGGRQYPGLQRQAGLDGDLGPQINPGQPGQPGQPAQPGQPSQSPLDIGALVRGTPGYQEQLEDGMTAIDRAAPLRGGMYSGRRMKALNDHGQRTFGNYYENWMNRVGGMAGQAPQIAQNVGQAGMQNANNVGNLMMTGANARAQGSLNSASAWTSALGNMVGMYGGSQGWFGR